MILSFISIIALIIGGVLASASLLVEKAPDAQEQLDMLIPYQGFVGIILIILGIRDFIGIFGLLTMLTSSPVLAILGIVSMITKLVLGFVLAFGLFAKYLMHNDPTTQKKTKGRKKKAVEGEEREETATSIYETLSAVQVPFGIVSILIGIIAFFVTVYFLIV